MGSLIGWTRLPFPARTGGEFDRGLFAWLGHVFYDVLPVHGYELREEQIYTTFRIAQAFVNGTILFAEAGSGTGKTFAYLLPAVCYARFRGMPVVVASASSTLQAQLADPKGDIQTLSRLLGLDIDARLAVDPTDCLCQLKADNLPVDRPMKGWKALHNWTGRTQTGARSEVPGVPDELWEHVAWDLSLPCDTCRRRGTCHVTAARRHYRAAADLVVTDHRFFCRDLLTRAERQELGLLPLLPSYSAAVLDEGHHLPDVWQRSQGFEISPEKLRKTMENVASYAVRPARPNSFAEARWERHLFLADVLVKKAESEVERFLGQVRLKASLSPHEGKQDVSRDGEILEAAADTALCRLAACSSGNAGPVLFGDPSARIHGRCAAASPARRRAGGRALQPRPTGARLPAGGGRRAYRAGGRYRDRPCTGRRESHGRANARAPELHGRSAALPRGDP